MALPSECVDEILCRLPDKDLLRFRIVSKEWCSLIDSTPFFKRHLKKALGCNALIIDEGGKFYSAEDFMSNLDDDKAVAVEIKDPLKTLFSGADSECLDEILCRLPDKDLLRFRIVSKEWCSLIDSTPFFKKLLKKALGYNALIIDEGGKFYSAEDFMSNLDDDKAVAVEIKDPLKTLFSGADSECLDEILCRLPVKDLLRFRIVSKGWCSLIDSSPFFKRHLKKALEYNALIINEGGKFYLAEDFKSNLDDDKAVAVEIKDPLKTLLSGADFVGSANGLVCVSKNKMNELLVFNPSTRKLRKIPSAPAEFPCFFHETETSLCGFGYDPIHDDYKIVKIAECYLQFRGKMVIVYSLKTNSWKRIRNVPSRDIRFFGDWGMFASGTLHWLAINYPINGSYIIVGFDLELEKFKVVLCPVNVGPIGNFNTRCVVSDGSSLCILDKYPNSRIDVWVMLNSSGEENSWSKTLCIGVNDTLGYSSFVRPVYFSRSGQSVLLEVDSSELVWYDLKRKTVKNVRIRGTTNEFDSHVYTQSLIQLNKDSPPQKPSQDKPHKEHQKRRDDYLSTGFKLRL